MYERAYGTKYDKNLDTKACAVAIRADIKAEIAAGNLPAGKYSVKMDRFSGGSSIDVSVSGLAICIMNRQRIAAELAGVNTHRGNMPTYSEAGKHIIERVEAIMQAYNHDGSDSQFDYFDVKFYGHASFCWEWVASQRKAIEDQERENPSYIFEKDAIGDLKSWCETKPATV